MNPEIYGYIMGRLFSKGALDVYKTSIHMKKDRVGMLLSVLCKDENKEALKEIIFIETTTLGIREYKVHRSKLKRDFLNINTAYGTVRVKNAYYNGRKIKWKPEYDDCKRLAEINDVPIKDIYDEVLKNVKE